MPYTKKKKKTFRRKTSRRTVDARIQQRREQHIARSQSMLQTTADFIHMLGVKSNKITPDLIKMVVAGTAKVLTSGSAPTGSMAISATANAISKLKNKDMSVVPHPAEWKKGEVFPKPLTTITKVGKDLGEAYMWNLQPTIMWAKTLDEQGQKFVDTSIVSQKNKKAQKNNNNSKSKISVYNKKRKRKTHKNKK